jgi:hypothetical protein
MMMEISTNVAHEFELEHATLVAVLPGSTSMPLTGCSLPGLFPS